MPVSVSEDKKIIYVHFDKIFNQDISHMNKFSLVKRRNYINSIDDIAEALQYIFINSNIACLNYLKIKYRIISELSELSEENLLLEIFDNLLNDEMIELIEYYIDETYTISLDENTKQTKNANKELQFTDNHAKIILKSSMAMKIVIPLLVEYINYNEDIEDVDKIFFECFTGIFYKFSDESVNIQNKITKLINSRIISTKYSDRVIWAYLKNLSIDSDILTRNLYKKIIANIIPKIKNNTNIVSFLHVVIKNSIRYQFTVNFPISYKPLNLNQTDSEGLSNFDKLEIIMVRLDEGNLLLNKLTVKKEIQRLQNLFGFNITQEEFDYYKKTIKINDIQKNLLFLFYSKYLNDYNINYHANFNEYIILCIILRKWLIKHNFKILQKYILAIPENYIEKKAINKKQFLNQLFTSKKYNQLLEDKFKFSIQNILDSGIIVKIIAALAANKFYYVPVFDEPELEDNIVLDEKIEEITSEILIFIDSI